MTKYLVTDYKIKKAISGGYTIDYSDYRRSMNNLSIFIKRPLDEVISLIPKPKLYDEYDSREIVNEYINTELDDIFEKIKLVLSADELDILQRYCTHDFSPA